MSEASPDEFDWIARLRPLTRGEPAAFGLMDDAAVLPARPGFDLVITKDAMVEGVHFLKGEDRSIVARRLIRTNLSDLAAKGAAPFGYFLMTAWTRGGGWPEREAFIAGLAEDGEAYGLALLGGDTVSTPGPLTVSATMLGWVPAGTAVRRTGALAGDLLIVTGTVGDARLGLRAARGEIEDDEGFLAGRYRLPEPRTQLNEAIRQYARACADVSDGLIADAVHIAEASGLGLRLELESVPLSNAASWWVVDANDPTAAKLDLATGGDDYELACAVAPADAAAFIAAVGAFDLQATMVGAFTAETEVVVTDEGRRVKVGQLGWRHG